MLIQGLLKESPTVFKDYKQAFSLEYVTKCYLSYFSMKTYVVGTPKNCLSGTVLLSIQNIC